MIDFSLTDEQRLLEQTIREWGARDVAPYIRENDRNHHFDRERILGGVRRQQRNVTVAGRGGRRFRLVA